MPSDVFQGVSNTDLIRTHRVGAVHSTDFRILIVEDDRKVYGSWQMIFGEFARASSVDNQVKFSQSIQIVHIDLRLSRHDRKVNAKWRYPDPRNAGLNFRLLGSQQPQLSLRVGNTFCTDGMTVAASLTYVQRTALEVGAMDILFGI